MKKLHVTFLVLAALLFLSNLSAIRSTGARVDQSNVSSFATSLASGVTFPTNATFETKAEVIGDTTVTSIGGMGSDYYAQSIKALSDYIVDGGLWIENYTGVTPSFRLMLCRNNESGWPDVSHPIIVTSEISNETINANPGRFHLNLTKPIPVQQNQTYWLVIDGYYDHITNGRGRSRRSTGDPYPDGYFAYSNNNGSSWFAWQTTDLDFIVLFSNRPNKVEVKAIGTIHPHPVGGSGTDYYAQSFKAMDSYVVDAGIWIENYSGTTPDLRVQIWGTDISGDPDENNVLASSRPIKGVEIDQSPGRFFLHPNVSVPVTIGETYWLVIDGYYDNTTTGSAQTWGMTDDVYEDGEYRYSNDAGGTWYTMGVAPDLDFVVTFSAQRSAIMVDGDAEQLNIGGTGTYNYYGERFVALSNYILDASVWLANYTNNCPDVRILLCPTEIVGSDPNVTSPIAASLPITGAQIMSRPGRYHLNPTEPVEVIPGELYYLMIDGMYDSVTPASVMTHYRSDNPYTDGRRYFSNDGGSTWWFSYDIDADVEIRFSDVPLRAQCGENRDVSSVGGTGGSDYYAQSFVALNDYLADAGIWLEQYLTPTPDFQILLCQDNESLPSIHEVIAHSMAVEGSTIDANPGLFYLKPVTPIPVEVGETCWVVINGTYDNVTAGRAQSRGVDFDAYTNGVFVYSNDDGESWHTFAAHDLRFEAVFTHVNQPPTPPIFTISPQQPYDSNNLEAQLLIPATDLEQELVTYYLEWLRNGVPQPAWAGYTVIPASETMPTDDWTVKATPNDGHINGTAAHYTVHVQADIQTIIHPVTADSQHFEVVTTSNTTITDFTFNQGLQSEPANITFTATGPTGAEGFCSITIPRALIDGPWVIYVNSVLTYPLMDANFTHTTMYLTYATSSIPIEIHGVLIIPEYPSATLLFAIALATLAIAAVKKRILTNKH